jgi:hypothetical protein
MEITMTPTLTRGEALDIINEALEKFINDIPSSEFDIEAITYAVNSDLQIRDYFLGLPADFSINVCIDFVNYLTRMTNHDESYAYDTISAMYQIEQGNTEFAKSLLNMAEVSNPNYNLTKLAKRIISAEWEGSALRSMREQLHSKVVEEISNTSDYVIGSEE